MILKFFKSIFDYLKPCQCGYCEPKTDADFLAYLFHLHIADAQLLLDGAAAGNARDLQHLSRLAGVRADKVLVHLQWRIQRIREARP